MLSGTGRLFIFGLGYVGRQVAYEALEQGGWHVSGSCRSPEKAVALRCAGVETFAFDLDDAYTGLEPAGLEALEAATHLLITVPPVADLDRDPLLALHMQQVRCRRSRGRTRAQFSSRTRPRFWPLRTSAQLLVTPDLRRPHRRSWTRLSCSGWVTSLRLACTVTTPALGWTSVRRPGEARARRHGCVPSRRGAAYAMHVMVAASDTQGCSLVCLWVHTVAASSTYGCRSGSACASRARWRPTSSGWRGSTDLAGRRSIRCARRAARRQQRVARQPPGREPRRQPRPQPARPH